MTLTQTNRRRLKTGIALAALVALFALLFTLANASPFQSTGGGSSVLFGMTQSGAQLIAGTETSNTEIPKPTWIDFESTAWFGTGASTNNCPNGCLPGRSSEGAKAGDAASMQSRVYARGLARLGTAVQGLIAAFGPADEGQVLTFKNGTISWQDIEVFHAAASLGGNDVIPTSSGRKPESFIEGQRHYGGGGGSSGGSTTTTSSGGGGGDLNTGVADGLYVNVAGDTMVGGLIIDFDGLGLNVSGTASGDVIHAQRLLTVSGSSVFEGNARFNSTVTINGVEYNFPGADGASSGKVLKTNGAGQLSWSDDDAVGTGLSQAAGDARYVKRSGDTMTGALVINDGNGYSGGILLTILGTASGRMIHAEQGLSSSGSLVWEGAASGATLYIATSIRGAGLTDCDAASQTLNWDATTGRFSCGTDADTTYTAGQGLGLNGTAFSLNAILTGTLLEFSTISGSNLIVANNAVVSGSVIVRGNIQTKGTLSGTNLIVSNNASISGSLVVLNNIKAKGTLSGTNLIVSNNASVSGSLVVKNNIVARGTISGATINGFNLGSCNGAGQKLQYNNITQKFECGVDTDTNTTYTAGQGLTLNGTAFSVNSILTGSLIEFSTLSGSNLVVANNAVISGSVVVRSNVFSKGTISGVNLNVANNAVISGALIVRNRIITKGTLSGVNLIVSNNASVSGVLLVRGNIGSKGTLSGVNLIVSNNASVSGSLVVRNNISAATIHANTTLTTSGSLVFEGTASGSALYIATSINGAGLTDCDAASQVLKWDSATGRFMCGTATSNSFGTGNVLTISDSRYVNQSGDTMTGALTVQATISGSRLIISENASVSGSLTVKNNIVARGTISGSTINGFNLGSCNSSTQKLMYNNATQKFECGTDLNTGSSPYLAGQGLTLNGTSFSVNSILTGSLIEFSTVSGSNLVVANNAVISGSVIVRSNVFSKGTISGVNLNIANNAVISGALIVRNRIITKGTLSGVNLIVSNNASVSGVLLVRGNIGSKGTLSGVNLIVSNNASVSGSLVVKNNIVAYGSVSGSTINGFNLGSCNGASQKLMYNNATQKFECGTDLNTGSSYLAGQGLTLNGTSFSVNSILTGSLIEFSTLSGNNLTVANNAVISGSVIVRSNVYSKGTISGVNLNIANNAVISGSLIVRNHIITKGTLSGVNLIVSNNASISGALIVRGNIGSKGTLSGVNLIIANNASVSGSLVIKNGVTVRGTLSGNIIHAEKTLTSSGGLVFEGAASGSSLYLGTSLYGAGLTDCTGGNKLLWNAATGRFSCGADQSSGSGLDQNSGDARYVNQSGDTMTGALVINITGGEFNTLGLRILNTLSGAHLHAERTLTTSGSLVFEGSASGASLYIATSINGVGLTDCDLAGQTLNWDATTGRFSCGTDSDTTYTAGQGLGLNGTAFSLNSILTGSLIEFSTVSGSNLVIANNAVVSGSIIVRGSVLTKGTLSGQNLIVSNNGSISGSLVVKNNIVAYGSISGATINGFNLGSCNGASQKLLYNNSTQKFECGTDLNTGSSYLAGQGLTLNGTSFSVNSILTGSLIEFSTLSGNNLTVANNAVISGSVIVRSNVISKGTISGVNLNVSNNAIISGSLIVRNRIITKGTLSGVNLIVSNNASVSGMLLVRGNIGSKGTISGVTLIVSNNASVSGSLVVRNGVDAATIHASTTLTTSGALVWEGAASGATLYVATSINGAGLTDCDLAGQTLNWDATTGRFSCGTDSDTTYTAGQGLGLNGTAFSLNSILTGSLIEFSTVSGSNLVVANNAVVSGAVIVRGNIQTKGTLSGQNLIVSNNGSISGSLVVKNNIVARATISGSTINGFNLGSCNGASQKLLYNNSTQKFECGTDLNTGSSYLAGQGLTLNGTSFSVNSILTGSLIEFSTLSGNNLVVANNAVISGSVIVRSNVYSKGTISGVNLNVSNNAVISGALIVRNYILTKGTLSGVNLIVSNNASVSGVLLVRGNIGSKGTISGSHLIVSQNASVSGALIVRNSIISKGTISGVNLNVSNNAVISGSTIVRGSVLSKGTLSGMNLIVGNAATISGSLRVRGSIISKNALSGAILIVSNNASVSGALTVRGNIGTRGTFSGVNLIVANNATVSGSLSVKNNVRVQGTLSGNIIHAEKTLTSSGGLVFEGTASGANLYVATSISGAGLTDCDDGTNSKLLWDAATGRFSCGTDQSGGTSGGGLSFTTAENIYVNQAGDTMTGVLILNDSNAGTGGVILNAKGTISGYYLRASAGIRSSGSLLVEGSTILGDHLSDLVTIGARLIGSGNVLRVRGTLSGSYLTTDLGISTSGALIGVGNTTLGDHLNDRITINGRIQGTGSNINPGSFDYVSFLDTISGTSLKLDGHLSASGTLSIFGATNLRGNVDLGDRLSDSITINGRLFGTGGVLRVRSTISGTFLTTDQGISTSGSLMVYGNTTLGNKLNDRVTIAARIQGSGANINPGSFNYVSFLDTISGTSIKLGQNISASGALFIYGESNLYGNVVLGDHTADTITIGGRLIGSGNLLRVRGTLSGSFITASQTISASGSILTRQGVSGSTLAGFGLGDCAGNSKKLLFNPATGKFSCGNDNGTLGAESFSGAVRSLTDPKFVKKSGDSMTGALLIGYGNTLGYTGVLLNVRGTISGQVLRASSAIRSSGSLLVEGSTTLGDHLNDRITVIGRIQGSGSGINPNSFDYISFLDIMSGTSLKLDGHLSASGSLSIFGASNLRGHVDLGDHLNDRITVIGRIQGSGSSINPGSFNYVSFLDTISGTSLKMGGNISASGSLSIFGETNLRGRVDIGDHLNDRLMIAARIIGSGASINPGSYNYISFLDTISGTTLRLSQNISASGSLYIYNTASFYGGMTLGDHLADNITVAGRLIASGSFISMRALLSGSSLKIDQNIAASGSLTVRRTISGGLLWVSKVGGDLIPNINNTYSLGTNTRRWKDLYLSGSSLHIGSSQLEGIIGYSNSGSEAMTFNSDGYGRAEMVLLSGGQLGLGTGRPMQMVHVFAASGSAAQIYQTNGTAVGKKNGSTFADDTIEGSNTWSSPSNAATSNNSYATSTVMSSTSYLLRATGFGFNLPSDAVITGILAEVERKATGVMTDSSVKMVKDGFNGSTNKAHTSLPWPSTDTYIGYGGIGDLWGDSWTAADINDADFGFAISVSSADIGESNVASIDHMRLTIYYTTPSSVAQSWTVGTSITDGSYKITSGTGFYSLNNDVLTVTTGKNVGIGTGSPETKLDVVGAISGSRLIISNNASVSGSLVVLRGVFTKGTMSGVNLIVSGNASISGSLVVKNALRVQGTLSGNIIHAEKTLTSSGSLIVENTISGALLWVSRVGGSLVPNTTNTYDLGSSENRWRDLYLSGGTLYMGAAGNQASIKYNSAAARFGIDVDSNGTNELSILSTGQVGIGTAQPKSKLDVVGTISGSRLSISGVANFSGAITAKRGIDILEGDNDPATLGNYARLFARPVVAGGNDAYTKYLVDAEASQGLAINTGINRSNNTAHFGTCTSQSTEQAKFGTRSVKFNCAGYQMYKSSTADDNYTSGNFTTDLWVYEDANTSTKRFLIGSTYTTNVNQWGIELNASNKLQAMINTSTGKTITFADTADFPTGQWVHVALERSGTVFRLYRNGSVVASQGHAGNLRSSTSYLMIGNPYPYYTSGYTNFTGYMDEIRISKIARYSGSFTPETDAYLLDSGGVFVKLSNGALVKISGTGGAVESGGDSLWSTGSGNQIYYAIDNVGIGTSLPNAALHIQQDQLLRGSGALYVSQNAQFATGATIESMTTGAPLLALSSHEAASRSPHIVFGQDGIYDVSLWRSSANTLSLSGHLIPGLTNKFDLGSDALRWRSLYLSGGTIYMGTASNQVALDYNTSSSSFGIDITNNGSNELTILSDGRIGIGTNSPKATLDVAGTISGTHLVVTRNATISGSLTVVGSAGLVSHGSISGSTINGFNLGSCNGASQKLLYNNSTQKFECGTDQNDGGSSGGGLGFTTAQNIFVNQAGDTMTGVLVINDSGSASGGVLLNVQGTMSGRGLVVMGTGAVTEPLIYTNVSTGRVGIGTSTPSALLEVRSDADAEAKIRIIYTGTPATNAGGGAFQGYISQVPTAVGQRLGNLQLGAFDSGNTARTSVGVFAYAGEAWGTLASRAGYLTFETTPLSSTTRLERLRVSTEGDIGINTTTPKAKLDVVGTISGSRLVISADANITGSVIALKGVFTKGTMSGVNLIVSGNASVSGALTTRGLIMTKNALSGAHLIISNSASISGSLVVKNNVTVRGTLSGNILHAEKTLTSSGGLVFEGSASGANLYVATSLNGAGLTDCDNATNSKLLWDATTGRFSCGADQSGGSSGGGMAFATAENIYVNQAGDTMTGVLILNDSGAGTGGVILNAKGTISGYYLRASGGLRSSGSLIVDGSTVLGDHLNDRVTFAARIQGSGANAFLGTSNYVSFLDTISGTYLKLDKDISASGSLTIFGNTQLGNKLNDRVTIAARIVGSGANFGMGTFNYVSFLDTISGTSLKLGGNISASGGLSIFGATVLRGTVELGDRLADTISVYGRFSGTGANGGNFVHFRSTISGTALKIDQGIAASGSLMIYGSTTLGNKLNDSITIAGRIFGSGTNISNPASFNYISFIDMMSGTSLKLDRNLSASGALSIYGDIKLGDHLNDTLTVGARVVGSGNVLRVRSTISGTALRIDQSGTFSGAVVLESSLTGSTLFGFGLADCDNATSSKLLYDATTGKFSCGADQGGGASGGGGLGFGTAENIYVNQAGDTMTGVLILNDSNAGTGGVILNAKGTISGYYVRASSGFRTSGSLLVQGSSTFGDKLNDRVTFAARIIGSGSSAFAPGSFNYVSFIDIISGSSIKLDKDISASGSLTIFGNSQLGNKLNDRLTIAARIVGSGANFGMGTFNYVSFLDTISGTALKMGGNITASGSLGIHGNATIKGSVDIGDKLTDRLTIAARIVGSGANFGMGTFNYVSFLDTISGTALKMGGNISASGSLYIYNTASFYGGMTLGDHLADNITVAGRLIASGSFISMRALLSGSALKIDQNIAASGSLTVRRTISGGLLWVSKVGGDLIPNINNTYSLGTNTRRWKDLYLSGSSLHIGSSQLEGIIGYSNSGSEAFTFNADGAGVAEMVLLSGGKLGLGTGRPLQAMHILTTTGDAATIYQTSGGKSGPRNGATFATDFGIGSSSWTSESNASTSNNSYATVSSLGTFMQSNYLKATNFSFAIPAGAVIKGIQVDVERKASTGTAQDYAVRIVKGDFIGSTDRSSGSAWPTADAYASYGGPTDLWGDSWTADDINGSTFGFALSAQNTSMDNSVDLSVDHIRITVYYSSSAAAAERWVVGTSAASSGSFVISYGPNLATATGMIMITKTQQLGIGTGTALVAKQTIFTDNAYNNEALTIHTKETTSTQNIFKIVSEVAGADDIAFRIRADGSTFSDNAYSSSGADYAEWFYSSDSTLAPGDVVCIDVLRANAVKRCDRDGDTNVMGIVSTNPAFIGNTISGADGILPPGYVLVGLIGQVPAHVIVDGPDSAIRPGDALAAASIPGFARKAKAGESTVGVALEPLASGQGTVNVLISRKNSSLTVETVEQKVLDSIAEMNLSDEIQQMVQSASENLGLDDRVTAAISAQMNALNLESQVNAIIDQRFASGAVISAFSLDPISASLVSLTQTSATLASRISSLSGSVALLSARLDGMGSGQVLHMAAPVQYTGSVVLSGSGTRIGNISFSGSSVEIGTLMSTGSLKVLGNITVTGLATFFGDVRIQGQLVLSNKQAGYAVIPMTGTSVTVIFNEPMTGTPVVTATPDVPVLYGVSKVTATGFTIRIAGAAEEKITFAFVALSADSPRTFMGTGAIAAEIPFPVNSLGQPVSTDPVWNSCIQGHPLILESGEPVSCARYHSDYEWHQPDLDITFIYNPNHEPSILTIPEGYVITVVPDASSSSSSSSSESSSSSSSEPASSSSSSASSESSSSSSESSSESSSSSSESSVSSSSSSSSESSSSSSAPAESSSSSSAPAEETPPTESADPAPGI